MIKTKKQCKASWKASNSKDISLQVDLNKRNQVLHSKCTHIYYTQKENN